MSSGPAPVRAWLALVGIAIPLFALSVDLNGVAVLLPDIAADVGTTPLRASAIVTATALGFAAPLLLVGRLADRFGARSFLLGGVALFGVGSAVCAVAGSLAVLVAGRTLQGVASACCFTTSLVVIDQLFDERRRPEAVGVWAAVGGIGGALGPLVASGLADVWSWRAFFAVNVALAAVAVVALAPLVPATPGDARRTVHARRLGVLAAGVALALGALQHTGASGFVAPVVLLGAVGVVLVVVTARRPRAVPLVVRAVTSVRSFWSGTAVATTSNWGSGVALVLLPSALGAARGLDVLETGMLFLAFSAPFALGGATSGPLVGARGGATTMAGALLLQAAGLAGLAVVDLDGALVAVVLALAVSGYGNGVAYSASTSVALGDVAQADAGEAAGLLTMLRLTGLTVAVAVSAGLVRTIDDAGRLGPTGGMDAVLLVGAAVTAAGVAFLPWRGAGATRR